MKISGFTIIKNAVHNEYPVVESIRSILPVVDEMIVLTGDSNDNTNQLIDSINDPKIRRVDSIWDPSLRAGGRVLAVETDKAFHQIDSSSDWAFYIQGDEVLHEKYQQVILDACHKYKDVPEVEGLLFKYLHFYGTFDYVGDSRKWYRREVRIIRNDKNIRAFRDAQGFRKGKTRLNVKEIDAWIYHYGWVKSPSQMKQKIDNFSRLWHEDDKIKEHLIAAEVFNYHDFDSLERFNDTHPQTMQERVQRSNWHLDFDTSIKRFDFKDRLLYYIEKLTGKRLFDFRNYKKI